MVAKLIVTSGKSAGRAISLKAGKLLIGRAEDCDIRPLGEEVSRRHCSVVATDAEMTVEDLKSRNGTYVNGVRIAAKTVVADGDILRVGPLELKISFAVPAAAVPQAAAPAAAGAPAASAPAADKKVDTDGDDVSRWLMADDEPAGMYDTTQSVRAASTGDSGPHAAVDVGQEAAASPESGSATLVSSGDSSASAKAVAEIQALVAARTTQPGTLPAGAKKPKTDGSRDAAAEALRKFFGKR
jgi:hypothetical protein